MSESSKPTCIVIGGNGFVGSAITSAARQMGWEVSVAGRDSDGCLSQRRYDVAINANGNARRFKANQDPLFDFEASVASVYRSLFNFQCEHYVLISTVDVYNDATSYETTREDQPIDLARLSHYGFHKRCAELLVERNCPRWHIFRLGQMVGDNAKKGPIYDLLHGQPVWLHPDSCMPYLKTSVVAAALLTLLQTAPSNEVYNICGRGSVPFRQVLEWFPPHLRSADPAGQARDEYRINIEKTEKFFALPHSSDQVREFVQEATRGWQTNRGPA